MLKGLMIGIGYLICFCVYGPELYSKKKLSPTLQLFVAFVSSMTILLSIVLIASDKILLGIGLILLFVGICVVWGIIVRKLNPISTIDKEQEMQYRLDHVAIPTDVPTWRCSKCGHIIATEPCPYCEIIKEYQ